MLGTASCSTLHGALTEDAVSRFRMSAKECRALAEQSTDPEWRKWLLDLAQDLEVEARKLESGEDR